MCDVTAGNLLMAGMILVAILALGMSVFGYPREDQLRQRRRSKTSQDALRSSRVDTQQRSGGR